MHPDQEIPVQDEIPDKIEFPTKYNQLMEHETSDDENTNNYYYEIEMNHTPPNNNFTFTPITNYPRDTICKEDVLNGWEKVENDKVPDHGPFTDTEDLNFTTES